MYFFNQGEEVYHVLADRGTGTGLCGAKMSDIEQWRLETGRPPRRVTEEEPVSLRLCAQCQSSLPDPAPAGG